MKKDFFALFLGRGVQAGLAFALLKIMTNTLSQAEVGNYYYIVAMTSWFALLVINPVGMYVNRHIIEWRDCYTWRSVLQRVIVFYLVVALMAGLCASISNAIFEFNSSVPFGQMLVTVTGGIIFLSFYQLVSGLQNILGSKIRYSIQIAIGQGVIFLCALMIFVMPTPTFVYWFLLLFLGNFIGSIFFLSSISREFSLKVNLADPVLIADSRQLLAFCAPILGVTLATWTQTQGYRIVISKSGSVEVLALMAVGLAIAGNIGGTVESLAQQYLVPEYYRSLAKSNTEADYEWKLMFEKSVMLMTFCCVGLFCFARPVLQLLTKESYVAATRFLQWGAIIEFLRVLTGFIYLRFVGEKRVATIVPIYLTSAILTAAFFAAALNVKSLSLDLIIFGLVGGGAYSFLMLCSKTKNELKWPLPFRGFSRAIILSLPFALALLLPKESSTLLNILSISLAAIYISSIFLLMIKKRIL